MAQCQATKKDGKQCQNSAVSGQKYCHIHANKPHSWRRVASVSAIGAVLVATLGVIANIAQILDFFGLKPIATASQPPISAPTVIGDMILIPSGSFLMGAKEDSPFEPWYGEFPEHEVYLKSYMIAKTEVTNAMYRQCVYESHCIPPMDLSSATKKDYYENTAYNTFPVIHVTWEQAKRFCEWRGQRLPTEAEWEKAARGEKANLFPWGDIPPSCALANSQGCPSNDTVSVGSFPAGASPYGVLDMAGNVSEWVMDWMDETYYQNSPHDNPTGPESGSDHIIRGGGWDDPIREQRSTARGGFNPDIHHQSTGFRCAMDIK